MIRRTTAFTAALVAAILTAGTAGAQYSSQYVRGCHQYVDKVNISTHAALTGLWTCAAGSTSCAINDPNDPNAVGALTSEVGAAATTAAVVLQDGSGDWRSYTLTVVDDSTFTRAAVACGVTDALAAISSSAMYRLNTGADSTLRRLRDGSGDALPLWLSTSTVGADALAVGGGYGDSGLSVSGAGALSADGLGTFAVVAADAVGESLRVYNPDPPQDGDYTQGAKLAWYLSETTDNGVSYHATEAFSIVAGKDASRAADWYNVTGSDLTDATVTLNIATNGVSTSVVTINGTDGLTVGKIQSGSFGASSGFGRMQDGTLQVGSNRSIQFSSTEYAWGTPDVDAKRSAAGVFCVSNGDGAGCDGRVSASAYTLGGAGSGNAICLDGSYAAIRNESCASYQNWKADQVYAVTAVYAPSVAPPSAGTLSLTGGSISSADSSVELAAGTWTHATGSGVAVEVKPTWNTGDQAGNPTWTALKINPTITSDDPDAVNLQLDAVGFDVYEGGNIGAAPPATCDAGTFWIDTDETDDTNCATTNDNSLCLCVATNTWVAFENN